MLIVPLVFCHFQFSELLFSKRSFRLRETLILAQNLKHLICFLPVFKVPKGRSRCDGVHIFRNGALAFAKR
jgi:hypothetical protein